jgi:hypothetical protein
MKTLAVLLLTIALCSCYTYKPYVAPAPDEPYNIKLNDTLGIKLGMSLADYSKHYEKLYPKAKSKRVGRDPCDVPDADDQVTCTVVGLAETTAIGPVQVTSYTVYFYKGKLYYITYLLASEGAEWMSVGRSLKEKFSVVSESDGVGYHSWSWNNSVSHMGLSGSRNIADLTMWLTKESNEHSMAKRNREQAKIEHDL